MRAVAYPDDIWSTILSCMTDKRDISSLSSTCFQLARLGQSNHLYKRIVIDMKSKAEALSDLLRDRPRLCSGVVHLEISRSVYTTERLSQPALTWLTSSTGIIILKHLSHVTDISITWIQFENNEEIESIRIIASHLTISKLRIAKCDFRKSTKELVTWAILGMFPSIVCLETSSNQYSFRSTPGNEAMGALLHREHNGYLPQTTNNIRELQLHTSGGQFTQDVPTCLLPTDILPWLQSCGGVPYLHTLNIHAPKPGHLRAFMVLLSQCAETLKHLTIRIPFSKDMGEPRDVRGWPLDADMEALPLYPRLKTVCIEQICGWNNIDWATMLLDVLLPDCLDYRIEMLHMDLAFHSLRPSHTGPDWVWPIIDQIAAGRAQRVVCSFLIDKKHPSDDELLPEKEIPGNEEALLRALMPNSVERGIVKMQHLWFMSFRCFRTSRWFAEHYGIDSETEEMLEQS
jgi:hypothetical protein